MVPALGYFAKTMKILAIISLVIGLLGLGAGLYCQFEVVPSVKSAERFSRTMSYDDPAYAAATIPGGMYAGNPDDIPSWGPRATFVTSTDTPDEVVYAVVSAVFENFDNFKRLHPAFANLSEEEMISAGLTAELHPGALKYYQERGWK